MFARTAIAKKFRIWVLDILDRETKSTSYDRTPLRQACDRLAVGNMLISDAYRFVADRYQVDHIDQIPLDKLAEATGYVYQLILQLQPTTPATNTANLKGLVTRLYHHGMVQRSQATARRNKPKSNTRNQQCLRMERHQCQTNQS